MLQLSERWAPYLTSQPEAGMAYQFATIVLHDGRRFDGVCITGGVFSRIDGSAAIPFREDDIAEITVTNQRPKND